MKVLIALPIAALALTACANDTSGYDPTMPSDNFADFGEATLMSATGQPMGNATFTRNARRCARGHQWPQHAARRTRRTYS